MRVFNPRGRMVRRHTPNASPLGVEMTWRQIMGAPGHLAHWLVTWVAMWFRHHVRALFRSIGYMKREAGQFIPACVGLGVIWALPLLLYLVVLNVQDLSTYWRAGTGVSAYLTPYGDESRELELVERLRAMPDVGRVVYRSSADGLKEFKHWSGLPQVLDGLSRNPLPAVLEVYHRKQDPSAKDVELLRLNLDAMPEISTARADLNWLAEYHRMGNLLWRILWVALIVVLSGTIFAIAFSVRMMVMSRREEIHITRLMGGSDVYIARPFMYIGCCYGLFSVLVACLLVGACWVWLDQPIRYLVDFYGGNFRLRGLGFFSASVLLALGGLLGVLSARWVVRTQLGVLDRHS